MMIDDGPVGAPLTMAARVEPTGAGLAEVEDPTPCVGVSLGAHGALAEVASVLVDALGSRPAWATLAFVQVKALQYYTRHSFPLVV